MTIADRLTPTGILYVNGEFDEVTKSNHEVTPTTTYTSELDEVTINNVGGGLARRITHDGKLLVTGFFDEQTKIS